MRGGVRAGAGDDGRALADGARRRRGRARAARRRRASATRPSCPRRRARPSRCRRGAARAREAVEVDRAVRAERRHDRRQDLAEHEVIVAALEERVEADCQPRRQSAHASRASSTPGRKPPARTRRGGSSAAARPRPAAPPGARQGREPNGVDGDVAPIASAVALAVPDGASIFASLCASTISARGRCFAASAAKRIISTAPSAKFGAKKTGTPARRPLPHARRDRRPMCRRRRDAGVDCGLDVRHDCVRRREVDHRLSLRRSFTSSCARRLERRREHGADLAAAPVEDDPHRPIVTGR